MKKILSAALLITLLCGAAGAYEVDEAVLNAITNNQIVDYNPQTKFWSRNLGLNHYVFTKHISIGSGSYTYFTNGVKEYELNSTYEFLYYGKLYAYSAHLLKFFELGFDGEGFTTRELTKDEVQNMFPDVKILLVSEFDENNEITVELPVFRKKAFMILNDTDNDYYKYQFEYYRPENKLFNNIFEIRMPRIMVMSHFKSRDALFPILRVIVKPVWKNTETQNEVDGNYIETTPQVQENAPKPEPIDDTGIDDGEF